MIGGTSTRTVLSNGINGVTGTYDWAPITVDDLARRIKGVRPDEAAPDHVTARGKKLRQPGQLRSLPWGVEPHDIARAGWGIVFPTGTPQPIRDAMQPLIAHRRRLVKDDARVKELTYEPGEDATNWLRRHEVSWHNVEPTKVPYYLLWVCSPATVAFDVTHEIDSDYCVGLLDFPQVEQYAAYVNSVIEYETASAVRNAREAVFFGTRHPFDDATMLSADWLVTPLANGRPAEGSTPAEPAVAAQLGFRQRTLIDAAATRQGLLDVLQGQVTPSILFTASHGMVWPNGDARQFAEQGALLCQDWPGFGSVGPEHYLAAANVPDSATLQGLITFHFACYGAGTPADDQYKFEAGESRPAIAPRPFLAALPQRLLSHRRGGALACIGHVERAWGSSITGITMRPQIRAFQRALAQIMVGKPVGVAVQEFNDLSATLSEVLSGLLGRVFRKEEVDDLELASTWTQRNDAAGFVLLGDPAVRLRGDLV